jgi:hypothetical protein
MNLLEDIKSLSGITNINELAVMPVQAVAASPAKAPLTPEQASQQKRLQFYKGIQGVGEEDYSHLDTYMNDRVMPFFKTDLSKIDPKGIPLVANMVLGSQQHKAEFMKYLADQKKLAAANAAKAAQQQATAPVAPIK